MRHADVDNLSASPPTALAAGSGQNPIRYKLAILTIKCLHDTAPPYLADEFLWSSDLEARGRLRSSSSSPLIVRRTRLSTVVDRAFPVAAARVWNELPRHVTSRLHHPCEFSAVVWRLIFSAVPFPTFCSTFKVTCVVLAHFDRFGYLLNYIHGYSGWYALSFLLVWCLNWFAIKLICRNWKTISSFLLICLCLTDTGIYLHKILESCKKLSCERAGTFENDYNSLILLCVCS